MPKGNKRQLKSEPQHSKEEENPPQKKIKSKKSLGKSPKTSQKSPKKQPLRPVENSDESDEEDFVIPDQQEAKSLDLDYKRHDFPNENLKFTNWFGLIIEEISLEGLDGITLEALWTRLQIADPTIILNRRIKEDAWNFIRLNDKFNFYQLENPRGKLVVFDRYKFTDLESGIVFDPQMPIEDLYPFSPVDDKERQIVGSCYTYLTRKDITRIIRCTILSQAEEIYANKLVIVASQQLRQRSLFNDIANPKTNITEQEYYMLERIGRSRKQGEITAGKWSLQVVVKDIKSAHYYRKGLLKNHLVVKQPFILRSSNGQNVSSSLFHLTKFYHEKKTRKQFIIEQLIDNLRKKPGYRMEYLEVKRMLGYNFWVRCNIKKLLKSAEFRQFVSTDVTVPYREMYPDASQEEWCKKKKSEEKNIRILQLVDPKVNVSAFWREEEQKEDSSDDEVEGNPLVDKPLTSQIYNIIFERGVEGLSLRELERKIGMDYYTVRSAMRILHRKGLVCSRLLDLGKQRYSKFSASCFKNPECVVQQIQETKTIPQDEENDETIDFVANILGVDSNCLKPPSDFTEEEKPNLTSSSHENPELTKEKELVFGKYKYLYESRKEYSIKKFYNKKITSESKSQPEDKPEFKTLYKNDHDFVTEELSTKYGVIKSVLPKPAETLGEDFLNTCKILCDGEESINFPVLYNSNKMERCLKTSRNSLETDCKKLRKKIDSQRIQTTKFFPKLKNTLTHCRPIFDQLGFSNTPIKLNYQKIFARTNELLEELKIIIDKDDYHTFKWPQSDIEDFSEDEGDSLSLQVNLEDVDDQPVAKKIVKSEFTIRLIDSFENLEISRDLLVVKTEDLPKFEESLTKPREEEILDEHDVVLEGCSETSESSGKRRKIDTTGKQQEEKIQETIEDPVSIIKTDQLDASAEEQDAKSEISDVSTKTIGSEDYQPFNKSPLKRKRPQKIETAFDKRQKLMENLKNIDIGINEYMGVNPQLLHQFTEDEMAVTVYLSTEVKNPKISNLDSRPLSEKRVSRTQIILDVIQKEHQVIDLIKFPSIIGDIDGIKPDKKTMNRLFSDLVQSGKVRIMQVILKRCNKIVQKNVLFDVSADVQNIMRQSIDEVRLKYMMTPKKDPKSLVLQKDLPPESSLSKIDETLYKYDRNVCKQYGYCAKFLKAQTLHDFLVYLIYDFSSDEVIEEDRLQDYFSKNHLTLDEECKKMITPVYSHTNDWKMFIPPLSQNEEFPTGWALVGDVIMRLPLSVFVKIVNINYVVPELFKLLNDPIKKHALVRKLPKEIRAVILNDRKYIYTIYENLQIICYMGLLQFGPQKFKEKDQVYIYLNKKAVIYDTTTSSVNYHHIDDKEYKKIDYQVDGLVKSSKYWGDLWHITANSKLGRRIQSIGKYIVTENVHTKPDMMEISKPVLPGEAEERDVGYLPGDGLGAGKYDSALWIHIKRNWVWLTLGRNSEALSSPYLMPIGVRKKTMDKVKVKSLQFDKSHQKRIVKIIPVAGTSSNFEPGVVRKPVKALQKKKRKQVVRKLVAKARRPKREYYDETDKVIMKLMGKSRASWEEEEDNFLGVARSVNRYLCQYYKKRTVVYTTIRDIMHIVFPGTVKKTSRAIQRRLGHLLKHEDMRESKPLWYYSLYRDDYVQKHFKPVRDKMKNCLKENELSIAFIYMMDHVYRKVMEAEKTADKNEKKSKMVNDFLSKDSVRVFEELEKEEDEDVRSYSECRTKNDVEKDLIKTIIHSCLLNKQSKIDWNYKLFNLYKRFVDLKLRDAAVELRDAQIISGYKKASKPKHNKRALGLCGMVYHLSNYYLYKQVTHYPFCAFTDAYEFFQGLLKYKELVKTHGVCVDGFEQGHGIGYSELATFIRFDVALKSPLDMLQLDENLLDYSVLVPELAHRYQYLVTRRNSGDERQALEYIPEMFLDENLDKLDETIEKILRDSLRREKFMSLKTFDRKRLVARGEEICDEKEDTCGGDKIGGEEIGGGEIGGEEIGGEEIGGGEIGGEEIGGEEIRGEEIGGGEIGGEEICHGEEINRGEETNSGGETNRGEETSGGDVNKSSETSDGLSLTITVVPPKEHSDKAEIMDNVEFVGDTVIIPLVKNEESSSNTAKSEEGPGKVKNVKTKEKTQVPTLANLSLLLNKGTIPELDKDEEKLKKLNEMFDLVRPSVSYHVLEDIDEEDCVEFLTSYPLKIEEILANIEADFLIRENYPSEDEIHGAFDDINANPHDYKLIAKIINFIKEGKTLGVSVEQIKERFARTKHLDLKTILLTLTKLNIILRVGVLEIIFVHFDYRDNYCVNINESENNEKVKMSPWIVMDGVLNLAGFELWLNSILSHCLSNPFATLKSIMKRFNVLRPIDVFFLVETLQELECLVLKVSRKTECDLFSTESSFEDSPGSFIDSFDELYVELDSLPVIKFGCFINRNKTETSTPFDDEMSLYL